MQDWMYATASRRRSITAAASCFRARGYYAYGKLLFICTINLLHVYV